MRNTIVIAQQQCVLQDEKTLDTSHVFAGMLLIDGNSSNAYRLLAEEGLDVPALTASLRSSGFISQSGDKTPRSRAAVSITDLSISADFNTLMKDSGDAATRLGHREIGTEHLLMAFLDSPATYGCRMLNGFGIRATAMQARFEQWMTTGTYVPEPSTTGGSPSYGASGAVGAAGQVHQVYRATRIGYLITVFLPLLLRYLVPANTPLLIDQYLAVMGMTIYIYVFPYVLSTYAIAYLFRTRARLNMLEAAPAQSMVGVELPFGLAAASGCLLCIALLPLAETVPNMAALLGARPNILAFLFCFLMLLNCVATIATHWLLTFNIRSLGRSWSAGS